MAAETPVYDLTVLLDADAPSERRAEILTAVEGAISKGGEIVSKHDWGVRNLAYEIDHHKDAEYHLIQLTGPPDLLDRLPDCAEGDRRRAAPPDHPPAVRHAAAALAAPGAARRGAGRRRRGRAAGRGRRACGGRASSRGRGAAS